MLEQSDCDSSFKSIIFFENLFFVNFLFKHINMLMHI
jgi:hypothetical protein